MAKPSDPPPKKESEGMGFSDSKPASFLVSQESADKQKPPAFEPAPQATGGGRKTKAEETKAEEIKVAIVPGGEGRQSVPPHTGPDLEVNPEGETRKAIAPVSPASTPVEEGKLERTEGTEKSEINVAMVPSGEGRQAIHPRTGPELEVKPDGEVRKAIAPVTQPSAPVEKGRPETSAGPEKPLKGASLEERIKVGDIDQPIDITSDMVETDTKDSLITFKGNVTARQRDMVIYADFLEAIISRDGKAIEKVTAGGNVKIQQGLRVANCEKAVFYNLEKKVVLTGEPRVWEGENMVSGEEIVVDINRDRVEVKGGSAGRGKAKISP
jgi:lipopolysaccharide export system protein LptA